MYWCAILTPRMKEKINRKRQTDRKKTDKGKKYRKDPLRLVFSRWSKIAQQTCCLVYHAFLNLLPGSAIFSTFFQVSCSRCRLKLSRIFAISPTGVRTHPSSFKVMVEGWKERAGGGDEGKEGPEVVTARVA